MIEYLKFYHKTSVIQKTTLFGFRQWIVESRHHFIEINNKNTNG